MKTTFTRRLSLLTVALIIIGMLLMTRLASFQFDLDMASYLQNSASNSYRQLRDLIPDRGRIFDRNMELLAGNTMEYGIGVSPRLIINKSKVAHDLAVAPGLHVRVDLLVEPRDCARAHPRAPQHAIALGVQTAWQALRQGLVWRRSER